VNKASDPLQSGIRRAKKRNQLAEIVLRVFGLGIVVFVLLFGTMAFELLTQTPKVGLVAGHWQNDPGAVCEDGLREVDVNLAIAQSVAQQLTSNGYKVDLLGEYDSRLKNYRASALVVLHSDSCIPGYSGFKVARALDSPHPERDDRLIDCLWDQYGSATKLPKDPLHVTDDMRKYHTFRDILSKTPAAIIELGYLKEDREILTQKAGGAAKGVVQGLRCFLEERP
jgi:N-acetylmuramoyl-L-alanine amidase